MESVTPLRYNAVMRNGYCKVCFSDRDEGGCTNVECDESRYKALWVTDPSQVLPALVDQVIAGDPEGGHVNEDRLMRLLVDTFCPPWVLEEIKRLDTAELTRWYA